MVVNLRWLGTYVQTSHDDHDDVVGRGEIDIVHDQDLLVTETRLGVDVGLWRGFGASLVLPLRLTSTSIRYLDDMGSEVELVTPGIHHRNERVSGPGDPLLLGSYSRVVGDWRLGGRLGFSVPVGRTEEDPFAAGETPHQHIQLGTGTVNPVLSVEVARPWGKWRVGGFVLTQQSLYENAKGYQAGDRYAGAVTGSRAFGAWTLRGGAEVQAETAERWGGVVHTDDGNQGRIDAMLSAGGSWAATDALSVDLGLKIPVVTHIVGGQLDMPAILELGATWRFGEGAARREDDHHDHGDDHDHDHDEHDHGEEHGHEDDPDHAHDEHDHEHEAVEPVLGKLTVVDYWASWCEPCGPFGEALDEIAAANPDVVVLKVDVTDSETWDVPLPYVEVFDREGKPLLQRSTTGDLDALIQAVKDVVAPPKAKPTTKKPARQTVKMIVTAAGFEPADLTVKAGVPVRLVIERQVEKTCATEIVMTVDGKRIEHALPLGEVVTVDVTFPTKGKVPYACAMDMIGGTITVE